jgi:hypothetical protein
MEHPASPRTVEYPRVQVLTRYGLLHEIHHNARQRRGRMMISRVGASFNFHLLGLVLLILVTGVVASLVAERRLQRPS